MVFKIFKPSATFSGVRYNEKKEKEAKGNRVHMENFGWLESNPEKVTEADLKKYLDKWSSFNRRTKNKQFHAVLSTTGRAHSFEELKYKALQMMYKLGYKGNPILIYAHNDTKNNHVHIVTSRIDANGKKISDSNEQYRSMKALNEVMKLVPENEFKRDTEKFLSYNFKTAAQLNLLFENAGYKASMANSAMVEYFKFGDIQGNIPIETIQSKINKVDNIKYKNKALQLREIVKKYGARYDRNLFDTASKPFSDAKPKLQSQLTKYLKDKHGLEFVFFPAKNSQQPFGYMVIDHKGKNIFKGSEIMKLSELISNTPNSISQTKAVDRKLSKDDIKEAFEPQSDIRTQNDFSDKDIERSVDELVRESMKDNDSGSPLRSRSTDGSRKKKRKGLRR